MAFSTACIAFGCEARKNKELIEELFQPIHLQGVDVRVIAGQDDFYTSRKNQVLNEFAPQGRKYRMSITHAGGASAHHFFISKGYKAFRFHALALSTGHPLRLFDSTSQSKNPVRLQCLYGVKIRS